MQSNMNFTIGNFRGTGRVNGLPVFVDKFPLTLGGVMGELAEAAPAKFGRLVSVMPDAPNTFLMGIPTGAYPRGILIADPAIMQNDPAMNDMYFEGRPATVMTFGLFQLMDVSEDMSDGMLGMEVWADDTTGEIGFIEVGGTPLGAGFTQLNANVYSKDGPNGTTVWLNWPVVAETASEAMPTVATPVANPPAGAVADNTPVLLYCATPDAVIHYTVDGSTPDNTDPVYDPALGGIVVTDAVSIRSIGYRNGYNASAVLISGYTVV